MGPELSPSGPTGARIQRCAVKTSNSLMADAGGARRSSREQPLLPLSLPQREHFSAPICLPSFLCRLLIFSVVVLTIARSAQAAAPGGDEITTLRQMKDITAAQAGAGPPVRLKCVVV